jgi:beta-galactosidase/beta-glucuronidase
MMIAELKNRCSNYDLIFFNNQSLLEWYIYAKDTMVVRYKAHLVSVLGYSGENESDYSCDHCELGKQSN